MVQDTSIQSFRKLHPAALGMRMLKLLATRDDFTDREMGYELGVFPSTISGVRRQLCEGGLVINNMKRDCRITGNYVHPWRITDKGRDLLAGRVPEAKKPIYVNSTLGLFT